jgi:phage terminase large subunit-like protein
MAVVDVRENHPEHHQERRSAALSKRRVREDSAALARFRRVDGAPEDPTASTRDQATIVFRVAAQMVRNDPVLGSMCRIVDSTKTIYLKDDPNSFYKAISTDAGIQDGINPYVVVFDELHKQKNRDRWDVFRSGSPTRAQPLLFAITTAGVIGHSPNCEEQHDYARRLLESTFTDPTYYPVIYGLDEKEDWTHEGEPARNARPATRWYKANPALGDFLPIDRIRDEARTAPRSAYASYQST